MARRTTKPRVKQWDDMTPAEQAELIGRFERREVPRSETRPLTKAERARFDRIIKRGRGRPRIGGGAKRVLISVEQGLLKRADAYAKDKWMTRSELIAKGLTQVMTSR